MIEHLLEEGFLEPLDLYFAEMHQPKTIAEKAFLAAVMQAARDGHICLDLDFIRPPEGPFKDEWKNKVLEGSTLKSPYLRCESRCVYLEKNYHYETDIIAQLKRLTCAAPLPKVDTNLSEEQQAALDLVRSENISIIAGGPGTGKTYLTSELVKSFGPSSRIILAAPTGKAAARLKERNPHALCSTLHALLKMKSSGEPLSSNLFLQAELIVVDEASMLDAKMMRLLLKSLPSGQRLVFLGDPHQLPPVETGSLFCDLIGLLPTAFLKKCHRSDRKEILDLAKQIIEGIAPTPQGPLLFETIQKFVLGHLQKGAILTPLREGPWGVKELNLKIDRLFHTRGERAVPIMITRSRAELGLFNGEMGLLITFNEKPIVARFEIGGEEKEFSPAALPAYELAYVLSVHKSQGSEFDHVLTLVPPGTEQFGKELLYTAVTRAKQSVSIIGEKEVIAQTIQHSSCRRSGIKKRWTKVHPSIT